MANNDPPSSGGNVTGDWTVTDSRSYTGVTINVSGNLIIKDHGSLTLSGVTLNINGASAGGCGIEVMAGGSLSTDGGTAIGTGTVYNFLFIIDPGATASLKNTTISKVGVMGNQYGRGVYIGSDDVLLDSCTVKDGYEGVHVELASPTIVNSTFTGHQYNGLYIGQGQPLVDNCTFLDCGHYGGTAAVYAEYANSSTRVCRISNCTIQDNEWGAYLNLDSPVLFENNSVVNSTVRGLYIRQSDAVVRNNNITQNKEHGIFIEQASPVIEGNNITENGLAAAPAAGINVYLYSNPVIRDNHIASNYDTGVHIRPWCAPLLLDNNITSNTNAGVKMSYCGNARLEGNNISVNYDGLNAQGSTPTLDADVLWANQNDGMHIDGGSVVFEGDTVTGSGMNGIHANGGSTVFVGNSTFTNNQWGMVAETGSSVLLVNGNFSGQFGGAFKSDGSSTLDWLVDAEAGMDGDNAQLRGNLTIAPGGKLSLAGDEFDMVSDNAFHRYIDISSGGELDLEGVNLTARDPAYNYQFTSAGTLQIANSTLDEAGWAWGTDGETAGIFINGGSASILSSVLEHNYCGLVLRGASATLEATDLSSNEACAVDEKSSSFEDHNGTVSGQSQYLLQLDSSSHAKMVNTTFDDSKVGLFDGPSVVDVYWYLKVKAQWTNGDPAAGAVVNVSDSSDLMVFSETTDPGGFTPVETVQQYSQRSAFKTVFTPHVINATLGGMTGEEQVTVDRSQTAIFTFTDSTPPELAITSPADPSYLPTGTVELRGTASDPESGIRTVEVSWNNATWYTANTTDGWASWNYTFQLAPTTLTLRARATDAAGLSRIATVTVTVELSAPFLILDSPKEGLLTNRTPVALTGETTEDATVTASVNGVIFNATNAGGAISGSVSLSEGANLIEITAVDRAGNLNRSTRNVTLDTIPPWITLELPLVSYTNQQSATINGSTDGAVVTVNNMVANLTGQNFSKVIILDYGTGTTNTTVEVVARDPAGNTNRTSVYILRDLTAPSIRIITPAVAVTVTNETSILVAGSTETENTLTVNGVTVPLDAGGNFSVNCALQEGVNIIEVRAQDPAGNSRRVLLTVHRDTVAPALTLLSPVDGTETCATEVDVTGTTEPGVRLTVNGEAVNVGVDGNFSRPNLPLVLGQNNITVTVVDAAGNVRTVTVRITRVETPLQPPQRPVVEPQKDRLEAMLPWILILMIIIGGAGAAAWIAMASRRAPRGTPRGRNAAQPGRTAPAAGVETARTGGTKPGDRPRTAQDMYAADYAAKFSRPAQPAATPWEQPPAMPARVTASHEISWGDEPGGAQAPAMSAMAYQAPGTEAAPQPYHQPRSTQAPAAEIAPEPDAEAHTKAVDSDIDDLLKKIGEASKKK